MAVYSLLKGRIGNILFEIAAGISLANRLGCDYFAVYHYVEKEYLLAYKNNLLKNIKFTDSLPDDYFYYSEPEFSYNEIVVPQNKNIVLDGFFQSEKYIDIPFVKSKLVIDEVISENINKKFKNIFDLNPVSIHVRRGDFLRHPKQHPVCSFSYYKKAMTFFPKETVFFIISDDITWCKSKFKGDNVFFAENTNAVEDLFIQFLCSGHIMSNSSYSWWGSWLSSQNKVIAPSPWFGISYKNLNTKDLIPKDWVIIKRNIPFTIFFQKDYLKMIKNNFFAKFFTK